MIEQDDRDKPRDAWSDPRLIPASQLAGWEKRHMSERERDQGHGDKVDVPTPRTDAEFQRVTDADCLPRCDSIAHEETCPVAFPDVLMRDFARQLERELVIARAAANSWKDDLMRATRSAGTRTHPNGLWMVYFEDTAMKSPEIFFGEGAEIAARRRYEQAKDHWSCHLLSRLPDSDPRATADTSVARSATEPPAFNCRSDDQPACREWCGDRRCKENVTKSVPDSRANKC